VIFHSFLYVYQILQTASPFHQPQDLQTHWHRHSVQNVHCLHDSLLKRGHTGASRQPTVTPIRWESKIQQKEVTTYFSILNLCVLVAVLICIYIYCSIMLFRRGIFGGSWTLDPPVSRGFPPFPALPGLGSETSTPKMDGFYNHHVLGTLWT